MTAYYNEIDPHAAQWLRNLIDAGLIAPGIVDQRSITEVTPDDLKGFTQVHFFAGVGVWSYALRQAGWSDSRPVWTGSCPCQPFSSAGKRKGKDDERHLWPVMFELIRKCRPGVVFGEQVASKDGLHWLDDVQDNLESENYAAAAVDLCAAGVGAPHIRQRLYWVAHSLCGEHSQPLPGGSRAPETIRRPRVNISPRELSRAGNGDVFGMAHSSDTRSQGRLSGRTDTEREAFDRYAGRSSTAGGMAHTHCEQYENSDKRPGENHPAHRGRTPAELAGLRSADGLVYADRERCEGQQLQHIAWGKDSEAARPGAVNGLAYPHHGREAANEALCTGRSPSVAGSGYGEPGAVNGFWRNAEWLPCRDGKFRPIKPGLAPLANGVAGRVGKIRAYGNALTAPVAEVFISSYMEAANDD